LNILLAFNKIERTSDFKRNISFVSFASDSLAKLRLCHQRSADAAKAFPLLGFRFFLVIFLSNLWYVGKKKERNP